MMTWPEKLAQSAMIPPLAVQDDTPYFQAAMQQLDFSDFSALSLNDKRLVLWVAQQLKERERSNNHATNES